MLKGDFHLLYFCDQNKANPYAKYFLVSNQAVFWANSTHHTKFRCDFTSAIFKACLGVLPDVLYDFCVRTPGDIGHGRILLSTIRSSVRCLQRLDIMVNSVTLVVS